MDSGTSSRWMLAVTAVGLAVGGVLALADRRTPAVLAWTAAAVLPLLPLIGEMVGRIRRRQPGVDVIAVLAVAASLAMAEFLTAAVIGLMLATGRFLEEYAAGRAERELTALVARAPREANRMRDGTVEVVEISAVVPGDHLVVRAGEVVPVDGVVVAGPALLDEAALTGEPLPVERGDGEAVASGAVNAADPFEMRTTALAAESTYAGIIRLVEQARHSRAPSMRLADRWAGWFVPLALAAAGAAWAASGDPRRGLAVLVVATPCPLLLAVPIAIVSGISRGARRGVVFRGGSALETLARVRNVVIDKTGTVTMGRPDLRSIAVFDGASNEDDVLRLAAAVDQYSTHVLARAVVEAARERDLVVPLPADVVEVPGAGVSARIDGAVVAVGKLDWLLDGRPVTAPITAFRRRVDRLAPSSVHVAVDGSIVGAILFDDQLRPDAAGTIRALRREGVERVVMASGDHPVVARSVGMAIGVDDVLAEATPRQKVETLEELRARGVTAMVGDGINDAPALAAADVGVAMGARGATASSEAADVVLVVDRLQRLVDAIGIARRSRRIAGESAAIGMGLSVVAMGFAGAGLLVPLAGALVQEGIDALAILNALRALGGRTRAENGHRLPADLARRLHREHEELMPRLDLLRDAADLLDRASPAEAHAALDRVRELLVDEILPHEAADEREIYPTMAEILPGDDPLATMSRSHREIFHLVDSFLRQLADVPSEGPGPEDVVDIRRTLHGLEAVLRLHFDQEEELYLALGED